MDLFISCKQISIIGSSLFVCAHFTVYLLFFQRLFAVFKDSDLQFSNRSIIISRAFLIALFILAMICIACFGDGEYTEHHTSCSTTHVWWLWMAYGIGDTVVCSLIQILFARRLLMVHLALKDTQTFCCDGTHSENCKITETIKILTKSTLLTFIAIITNQVALIISGILGLSSLWTSVNSVINCCCVILMFKCHHGCYDKLCGHCTKIITIDCLYCYSCDCICVINNDLKANGSPKQMESAYSSSAVSVSRKSDTNMVNDIQRDDDQMQRNETNECTANQAKCNEDGGFQNV